MDNNLKVNELAALFGVTARTISDLARRGIIARDAKGFDRDEFVRRYVRHLREAAAGRGQAAGGAAAVSERARLAAAQADAQEMKNRVASGKLLDSDEVQAEWVSILKTVRAALLAAAQRCSGRRPHWDSGDVAAVDDEMRAILIELANDERA